MKTIYYNGTIYTGETIVNAFVTENEYFIETGDEKEILAKANKEDTLVDLNKAFVCAGFNDSHMHLFNYGCFLKIAHLNEHTFSLSDMLDYSKEFLKNEPVNNGQWFQGRGWNQDYFTDVKRMPNRYDLDKISKDIPIMFMRTCGHCCVVNSKALEICNINSDTPQVYGGEIGKENGEINGLFFDNAIELILCHIPILNKEEIKERITLACKALNSYGITSCQSDDYSATREISYKMINQAFNELVQENKLTVRVYEQANFDNIAEFKQFINEGNKTGVGNDYFKIGPLKLLGDGSLGSRTACLSKPYKDEPNNKGFCIFTDDQIEELIDEANNNDMQIAVHAIGDACLDQVLNAYKKALDKKPRNDHRHGIVHCQVSRKDQLKKINELNLHVYAQSIFLDYDNHIVNKRLDDDLSQYSYHWKTLMKMGTHVSNGSDAPVEIPDVLKGIECAITRCSINESNPYHQNEAFSVAEAINSFTIESAISSFEEKHKGLIKEKYLADFVILEKDPFKIDPKKIHDIKILATYSGGRKVF